MRRYVSSLSSQAPCWRTRTSITPGPCARHPVRLLLGSDRAAISGLSGGPGRGCAVRLDDEDRCWSSAQAVVLLDLGLAQGWPQVWARIMTFLWNGPARSLSVEAFFYVA